MWPRRDLSSIGCDFPASIPRLRWPRANFFQRQATSLRHARRMYDSLGDGAAFEALFRDLSPEMVIIENMLAQFALTAQSFGKPVIMTSGFLSIGKDPATPPLDSNLFPADSALGRFRVEMAWARHLGRQRIEEAVLGVLGPSQNRALRQVARRYDISLKGRIDRSRYLFPTLRLPEIVHCPREFDFPRPSSPRLIHCGPGVNRPRIDAVCDWSWLDPRKPLVYCAMGSMMSALPGAHDLLRKVTAVFAGRSHFQLLLAIGRENHAWPDPQPPGHTQIVPWAPQLEVLSRASVFLTHGGLNSVKESISFGVPMVVLPFSMTGSATPRAWCFTDWACRRTIAS